MTRIPLTWTVGHHRERESLPERSVPASAPGAVQLDWAAAEGWAPYWYADQWREYAWMEDVFWTYRAPLREALAQVTKDQRAVLVIGGVDYRFDVLLGERVVHSQEGMFTPVELDLSALGAQASDELRVRVFPAPKSCTEPATRVQANCSCKPAVSYHWDFHARLIPLGIWQDAYVEIRPRGAIRSSELTYRLSEKLDEAQVRVDVSLSEPSETTVRWRLLDPRGKVVAEQTAPASGQALRFDAIVARPQLWWPHDQGAQTRYTSVVERLDTGGAVLDAKTQRVGFRRVKLVMHEGAWRWPNTFPKGPSNPPITLEINGRAIFCKGSNWVSPEIFPGVLNRQRYEEQLRLVRDANMNMLRLWGGAPVQKDDFYDLCDELGILIWQEFPLACNNYPDDDAFLVVLEREARSIITRLRPHPCVVLWCGGNELFNAWSGMTMQSHALRLLDRVCFEMDRFTPFLPTSPVMGMAHGYYGFRDMTSGQEAWSLFQNSNATAYTEFGVPGPSPVHVLKKIIPEEELWPPKPGTTWETHHAFKAWIGDTWLALGVIEHYFGKSDTLEELVAKGQLLQAEGYRGLFEEARRQKPVAAMALNWCLNEPWPNAANNSLIAWPNEPKPALAAVAAALRPVLASAKISKFLWREGEWFDPELWVLNDSPAAVEGGRLTATLHAGVETVKLLDWEFAPMRPNTNARGPRAGFRLGHYDGDRMELRLTVDGRPELDSTYTLAYRRTSHRRESVGPTRVLNL